MTTIVLDPENFVDPLTGAPLPQYVVTPTNPAKNLPGYSKLSDGTSLDPETFVDPATGLPLPKYVVALTIGGGGGGGGTGAQGAQGDSGAQGAQGASGSQGAQGAQGSGGTGPQGAQGAQGASGVVAEATPGLRHPDNPPDNPTVYDDEFENSGTSLLPKWTISGAALVSVQVAQGIAALTSADMVNPTFVMQASPAGNFKFRAKMAMQSHSPNGFTQYTQSGIVIYSSSTNRYLRFHRVFAASGAVLELARIDGAAYISGEGFSINSSNSLSDLMRSWMYFEMEVVGTSLHVRYSVDGSFFYTLWTEAIGAGSFLNGSAISNMGMFVHPVNASSIQVTALCDWFRVIPSGYEVRPTSQGAQGVPGAGGGGFVYAGYQDSILALPDFTAQGFTNLAKLPNHTEILPFPALLQANGLQLTTGKRYVMRAIVHLHSEDNNLNNIEVYIKNYNATPLSGTYYAGERKATSTGAWRDVKVEVSCIFTATSADTLMIMLGYTGTSVTIPGNVNPFYKAAYSLTVQEL